MEGDLKISIRPCLLPIIIAFLESGCVTVSSGPDRGFDPSTEATAITAAYITPDTANITTRAQRNNFVYARMYAIDLNYSTYFEKLLKEKQQGDVILDAGLLGITAAGTVAPTNAAKTAFGAASTALAGVRTDIDQDIYMSATLQILMNTMEAQRLAIRNRIDANAKTLSLMEYPAWRALTDTDDYYRAGTLAGALQYLSASTGQSAQSQKELQNGTTDNAKPSNAAGGANQNVGTPTTSKTSLGGTASALPK